MSEKKPEYHILSRRSYHELEYDLNALAAEGYELVGHSLGSQDIYPSVVLRLRLDAELMPRLDELLALAQAIGNERVDLEARLKALEFMTKSQTEMVNREFSGRIKALEDQVKESKSRLDTLAYDHSNHRRHAGEELHDLWLKDIKLGARLDAVVVKLREMESALSRYQDTHATTHQYLDARKVVSQDIMTRLTEAERRIESVDSTMADAVLARLESIEKRLDAHCHAD